MAIESGEEDKLPDAGGGHEKHENHCQDSEPLAARVGLTGTDAVAADIFGEAGPVAFGFAGQAAGPVAGFKSFQPLGFVKVKGAEITADEAFAEDASGEFTEVSGFDVDELTDGELRRGAHGFE